MSVAEKKWFPVFLERLITVAMVVGAIIIVLLPFIVSNGLDYYGDRENFNQDYYTTVLCFLYPSGLIGLAILYQARQLLVSVNKFQPFIMDNVKRIRYISWFTAALCLIYVIAVFFIYSFFVPILVVVFGLVALFAAVLCEVFKKAVIYKEENDLTI